MFIAYKGLKNKSVKFKILSEYAYKWLKDNKISKDLHNQVVKNTQDAVSLYLRQEWMKSNPNIRISVHENTPIFGKTLVNAIPSKVVTPIQLGTEVGDANFKMWIESVMIPKWKKEYPNNKFIQGLKPTVNMNTNRGTVGINYGLSINMLPKSDYEKSVFNDYIYEFNSLGLTEDGKGQKYDIKDLLYLYSLITNNGKIGPRSLHKIFNDYIKTRGPGSLPYSYRKFINEKDSDPTTYEKIVEFLGKGYMISPIVSNLNSRNGTIVRYRDSEAGKVLILEIKKDEKKKSGMSEEDYYDNYDYDDSYQDPNYEGVVQMDDEFGDSEHKPKNYGAYTPVTSINLNSNPIYFQNAISTEAVTRKPKNFEYSEEFDITLNADNIVIDIKGKDEESEKIAEIIIKDMNKHPEQYTKITLNPKQGERVITNMDKIKTKIDKLKSNC